MLINSDWHIHSEYSYDAKNSLESIAQAAKEQGLVRFGITDHLNYNDEKFTSDIRNSANAVKEKARLYPSMVLGVELTPIALPEFEYIKIHHTSEGYLPPDSNSPYGIELAMTKDELMAFGIRYAVGASHWRVDVPYGKTIKAELMPCINEWYRQQMWLAADERVTILGHPWYNGEGLWYEDFTVIPRSVHEDIASVLREKHKFAECNSHFFTSPMATERFRHQYAEYLRWMFESGIRITYGSDSHSNYSDLRESVEKYLREAGFAEGDISELSEADLW